MRKVMPVLMFLFLLTLIPQESFAYRYVSGYPRWKFSSMPITFYITYTKNDNWSGRSQEAVEKMIKGAFAM